MKSAVLNRTLQRSRNYYDIPTENTVVILTGDFFRKIKTLPIALAKIALDTIYVSYPNLMMPDVIMHEATGNVFHPCDRLVCAWAERCKVSIMATLIGKRLKDGEIPVEAAAELSVEEAALLCPPGTRTYRVDSDGSAWFRFRPMEVADLNLPVSLGDSYLPHSRSSSYDDTNYISNTRPPLSHDDYHHKNFRPSVTGGSRLSRPSSPVMKQHNNTISGTCNRPVPRPAPTISVFQKMLSNTVQNIKTTVFQSAYRSLSSLLAA